ncbi:MAG: MFS transporter [Pseudomonadota bacterium]
MTVAGAPPDAAAGRAADARLFGLLACLYFAQGLPSGLLGKALPTLLREHGVSLSAIGFTALLATPWALKFLWAPFVDRFGTRRQWLLALNTLTLALMLLLASRDIGDWIGNLLLPFMLVLFLVNLTAATQDIATDGLAVSRLTPRLRGPGNSVQVIGYKIGMVIGGGVLLVLVDRHGWSLSYGALSLLIIGVLLPLLFMREPPRDVVAATHVRWHGMRGYLQLFRDFMRRPGLGWWLVAVAAFKLGDALASRMIGPLLRDSGLSLTDIGVLTGVTGSVAGIAGALAGGLLLVRIGQRSALLLFGALQAAGLLGYLWVVDGLPSLPVLYLIVCCEQFADGLSTVALFTAMMEVCRRASPGTDYTLQASLQVTLAGLATLASGVVADALGYGAVFVAGAALTLLALVPVWLSFARRQATVAAVPAETGRAG